MFACAAPCGMWFTQALCLRPCPSRFQPSACAATCDYDHSSLIPDDSALVWSSDDASSQVQSDLDILRMFLDAHISQVAPAAASTASLHVQVVQAVAAFRAGVRAFVSCFTLVDLFVRAWNFCVAISFWTEFEFHFLSATKGFGYKEDKQIRKVQGLRFCGSSKLLCVSVPHVPCWRYQVWDPGGHSQSRV